MADIELLDTFWQGLYFVEFRLPFSLQSSVFIFNCFADALAWILRNNYLIDILTHYLLILDSVILTSQNSGCVP